MAKVTDPHRTVLTGPQWLADMLNGQLSPDGTAKIEVGTDANGLPIVSANILQVPEWAGFGQTIINGKPLIEWLTEIPYTYNTETE